MENENSSSSSDITTSLRDRVRTINLSERARIAKKSTAPQLPPNKYAFLTKRQAALASKDKSKDIAKILNADVNSVDSESTPREKRRPRKEVAKRVPGAVYDSNGIHISGTDLCDCLQQQCSGCHFPCPKCSSTKCGLDCRVNRKFIYEMAEYHGYEFVIKNPLLKKT